MPPRPGPTQHSGSGVPALSEIRIEGTKLLEELGRGANTIVYRAEREGRSYALKIVVKAGDRDNTAAFAREAALLASLQHPGLVDIYEVGQTVGRPYLIMELVDGRSLSRLIHEERLDSTRVAAIGAQIAATLGVAHVAGLVHRDVKPDNILVESDGRVRLIDFGLAAKVKAHIDDEAVGTFLYSAPEQTGVLRRPVDGRADLYALGVVLYQCLTGEVPFTAGDTGELIRMHLTAPVPDPRRIRPDVEPSLAAVITRLMAKDPDDRYLAAEEVHGELARIAGGDHNPDVSSPVRTRSASRPPLVGRAEELARLRSCWEDVARGSGTAVLVTGATGVGKSRLVDSFATFALGTDHPLLRGAGSVGHRIPLAPLLDALDHHLAAVAALPEPQRSQAVTTLTEVAGAAARLLSRFVPRLGELVGLPAEPVVGPPQRSGGVDEDRFAEVVIRTLIQLADANGGALLLLEDAQWWDGATRELVRRLATALSGSHLMLLVTARNDNQEESSDIPELLGPAMAAEIRLGHLSPPLVADLVRARLGGRAVPQSLVARIVSFSGGNPLVVVEYLRAVLDSGAIQPSWGAWVLDEAALDQLQLPADIFDLTLRRVSQLRPGTQSLLVVAAAIGNQFALDLVETVLKRWHEEPEGGSSSESVDASEALTEAIGQRLVEPAGNRYAFPHGRIRQALLAKMDESSRRALHQSIGEAMEAASSLDTAAVYEIAQHYLNGQTDRDPRRLFRAIVAAGERALAEYASAQAYDFFERAAAVADAAGIDLDARFHQSYGMAATRVGEHQVAQEQVGRALDKEHDSIRRAALYSWLAESHHAQWEGQRAVEEACRGLVEIGRPLPHHPAVLALTTLGRMLGARAWHLVPLRWRLTRGDRRAQDQVEVRLLSVIKQSASYAMRMSLAIVTSLRSSYVAARLGPGPEDVDDQLIKAVSAATLGRWKSSARLLAHALAEATTLGDPALVAQVHLMRSLSTDAFRPPDCRTGDIFKETLLGHGQWLQASDYLLLASQVGLFEIMRGHLAEATAWYDRALRRIPARGAYGNPTMALGASIAALSGDPAEAASRLRGVQAFADSDPSNMTTRVNAALTAAHVALEQGELGAPFEDAIAAFEALKLGPRRVYVIQRTYWVFKALGRLAQAASATEADRPARLEAAGCAVRELRRAGKGSLYGGYASVAEAWFDHLCGKQKEALARLATLDADPEGHDSALVDYEAARVRARVLMALGRREEAIRHAEGALSLATGYGWKTRARWVDQEFAIAGTAVYTQHAASPISTEILGTQGSAQLRRLQAVHQVSLAASAVLEPRQLCRVALDETLRILAAERAFLFLVNAEDDQLVPYLGRDTAGTDLETMTGYGASLVQRVRANSQALVVTGCEQGAALGSKSTMIHGLRSIIVAPVLLRDQLLGVMYLDSRAARGIFTTDDLEILSAISHQVAVTFETARAARLESDMRTAQRERDLAEMLRLAMIELSGTLDPDEVIRRMVELIGRAVSVETWSLLHRNEDRTVMVLGAASGKVDGSEFEAQRLLSLTEPSNGTSASTDSSPFIGLLSKRPFAWMGIPLQTRSQGRGVLVVATGQSPSYTDAEVRIAATLAGQGMAAYENARLFRQVRELATRDPLTGLYNRRHFLALASSRFQETRRQPRPSAAVMVDIDLFKKVNDTYGHGVGDEVIREVASRLSRCLREEDVICRYGGEEFAVLLSGASAQQADVVAARLHAAIGGKPVDTAAGPLPVTVSVGVTTARFEPADAQGLLSYADQALYAAKRAGRNQVVRSQSSVDNPNTNLVAG